MKKILKYSLYFVLILLVLSILFPEDEVVDEGKNLSNDTKQISQEEMVDTSNESTNQNETSKELITENLDKNIVVKKKGTRIISIDITDSSNPDNYQSHIDIAKSFGVKQLGLFLIWDWIEPNKGEFNSEILDIASMYYPSVGVKIDLTLAPIETITTRFPKDLQGKKINDKEVIARFKTYIDYVLDNSKFGISSVNIGSEFDILYQEDEKKWNEYLEFYKEIYTYLKTKNLGVPITTEATHDAFVNTNQLKYMKQLASYMDVIAISYYPMKKNGDVKEPKTVHEDFKYFSSLFPNKKIWFYQYGYPSSTYLNSSQDKQSEFIVETFKAWDTYKDNVQMIDFTWMHDLGNSKDVGKRYGSTDKGFLEFLGTLGLRTFDEKDKKSLGTLKSQANLRGF